METIAVEHPCAHRAEQGGKNRGHRCHDQAVLKGGQQGAVLEKSRIPLQGESLPADVQTRAVERKNDQKQDRYVKKRKNQRGPESKTQRSTCVGPYFLGTLDRLGEVVVAATAMRSMLSGSLGCV